MELRDNSSLFYSAVYTNEVTSRINPPTNGEADLLEPVLIGG